MDGGGGKEEACAEGGGRKGKVPRDRVDRAEEMGKRADNEIDGTELKKKKKEK